MLFKKSACPVSTRCGQNVTDLVVTFVIRRPVHGCGDSVDDVLDRWRHWVFFIAHNVDPSGGRTPRGGHYKQSPVRLSVPHSGDWTAVVVPGAGGTVTASVRVFT
jgi:hypothetical protein